MVNTEFINKFLRGEVERRHSEVLNKILAGYIDSDGCISYKDGRLSVSLSQAAVNDPDFEVLRAFFKYYGVGSLSYRCSTVDAESSRCDWRVYGRDAAKLLNLIGKHLITKGKYADKVKSAYESKTYETIDRGLTGPVKRKKRPSTAWLAGLAAGDGHFCCRLGRERKKFDKERGKHYSMIYNELYIVIVSDKREPLDFIQEHYGGSVCDKGTYFSWKRSLGKGHKSFSLAFLHSIKRYMLHPKKRSTIERMEEHLRTRRD
jgi:hypothetical protein